MLVCRSYVAATGIDLESEFGRYPRSACQSLSVSLSSGSLLPRDPPADLQADLDHQEHSGVRLSPFFLLFWMNYLVLLPLLP